MFSTCSPRRQLSDFTTGKMSVADMEAAILQLNNFDAMIYKRVNDTLWGKIDRQVSEINDDLYFQSNITSFLLPQVSYAKEVQLFRSARSKFVASCEAVRRKYSESELKRMAPTFADVPSYNRHAVVMCYLSTLPRDAVYEFLQAHTPHLKQATFPPPTATLGSDPV